MKNGSASSSKQTRPSAAEKAREGPFDPRLLEQAALIAARYRVILERAEEGAGGEGDAYLARGVEFPAVVASAPTAGECEAKIREMLTIAVATMLEMGERPPLPVSKRRLQLNIRLSGDEKAMLEESAQRAGFRGLSEFVRFAALAWAGGARGQSRDA